MPEYVIPLLGALIGAVIGSLGAVVVGHRLTQRAEERRRRETLARKYLFQLQDAVEALWFRLNNLAEQWGRHAMASTYFETTTLYALGRVLAVERIIALEGVYPELVHAYPELGERLRKRDIDQVLGSILGDRGFQQYDRISLAEALIETQEEQFRPSTYLEFRGRYEAKGSHERQWLEQALRAIQSLGENSNESRKKMEELKAALEQLASLAAKGTGLDTTISGD
jgi:gas vesicle protein